MNTDYQTNTKSKWDQHIRRITFKEAIPNDIQRHQVVNYQHLKNQHIKERQRRDKTFKMAALIHASRNLLDNT